MSAIEPWFRLLLCVPHVIAPFVGVGWTDMPQVFVKLPELQKAGWIALVLLSGDAIWRIAGF